MNNAKFREIYDKILNGNHNNIKFTEACEFVRKLGFIKARQKGTSHLIFKMPGIPELINLQDYNGNAKPYQIDQIKKIMIKYKF